MALKHTVHEENGLLHDFFVCAFVSFTVPHYFPFVGPKLHT